MRRAVVGRSDPKMASSSASALARTVGFWERK